VFSVVLYTGEVPWGSNTNVRQLLAEPAAFHPFAPDWGPVMWNLAERTPEQLLAGGPWLQFMAVMRAIRTEWAQFEPVVAGAIRHLAAIEASEPVRWYELLAMVLTYSVQRRAQAEADLVRQIAERENPARFAEIQTMAQTAAEVYEERGAIRLAKATLRQQLQTRFGGLSESLLQQIDGLNDLARLNAALIQVVQVKSLDEFKL
jgi:hypothetical protein